MNIKKEFSASLSAKSVIKFFDELRKVEAAFLPFESLQEFIDFMAIRVSINANLQDECLLAIVRKIKSSKIQEGGLNLLTYLLAPGLQCILHDIFTNTHDLSENWLNLWWEFFQSIDNYPLDRRQRKVSANLLFDTRHRIIAEKKSERTRQYITERIEDCDLGMAEDEQSPYYKLASSLIEGAEDAGLNRVDRDLVISSRVYNESMKMLAKRWGLKYRTALQKRYRAEKVIRKHWKLKDDEKI